MTNPDTGLPSDNIDGDLDPASRAAYTSPTNIGMYIWATLSARDLQLITPEDASTRIAVTLDSVAALERHEPSGQFYNWYDPRYARDDSHLARERRTRYIRSCRASTTGGSRPRCTWSPTAPCRN